MARRRVHVTDAQWAKIEPLLPRLPRTRHGGRPWIGNRAVVDGILWVLETGARWCDLPTEYPSPSTCWRRLKRWDEDGTWLRIWRSFIAELDERGRLQWETAFIDGGNSCCGDSRRSKANGRWCARRSTFSSCIASAGEARFVLERERHTQPAITESGDGHCGCAARGNVIIMPITRTDS